MATKYLALEQLQRYHSKAKEAFVAREHKTGSEEEWKVLSDNNLTDELLAKIHAAGDSGFNGAYDSLTGKPAIDGNELSSSSTASDLGLATSDDISDMATKTELADYAKSDKVASDISDAKEEVLAEAKALVTGVYTPKGSVAFDGLPTPSKDNVGFVYDVNEQFVTDDKFNDQSKSYPAGTNVVVVDNGGEDYKYDVLSGSVDLSGYLLKADVEPITDGEIDALFAE